jgi:hypothetical protein
MTFSTEKREESGSTSFIKKLAPQAMNGLMITGGVITAYGISTIIWDLTGLFINLTPAATGYYGFIGGFATSGIFGGLMYYVERWYTIRPNTVFWWSLRMVNKHEAVRVAVGHDVAGDLKATSLRAFRQEGGYWTVLNGKLTWKKPRVQMVYAAVGGHGDEAIVMVEASRSGFNEEIESICVDLKDSFTKKPKKRILVKGTEDFFAVADDLKSAVDFNMNKRM